MQLPTLPVGAALRRRSATLADITIGLGVLILLFAIARVGAGAFVRFTPANVPSVNLNVRNLPYYAARSTLRMFAALFFSLVFTLAYGYACARSRRAEKVLLPCSTSCSRFLCWDFSP